jgi:chaperonin GroES
MVAKEQKQVIMPVMDRVFVRLDEEKQRTAGGILTMTDYHHRRNSGVVVGVGPEVKSVRVGERVLFHKFDDLPSACSEIVVVRENSILGVYEDE